MDKDNDGYYVGCDTYKNHQGPDCNDLRTTIHPGAVEICDRADNQCPGDTGNGQVDEGCPPDTGNWEWVSGAATVNSGGTYGTKGLSVPINWPPARDGAISWTDSSGNLWMFGGTFTFPTGWINDLWKFDGLNWIWWNGGNTGSGGGPDNAVYGTKGQADSANVPGGRSSAVSWIDSSDNLWLFGGGYGNWSGPSALNDLWKFDGTNWTWVSGSDTGDQIGNYGIKGIPDPANVPSARFASISWIDSSGNMWLFGGLGDRWWNGSWWQYSVFNDLWKFDGTNWTWVRTRVIIS